MQWAPPISEAEILSRVVEPSAGDMTREMAEAFLRFRFDPATTKEIRGLLRKNNRGVISAEERIALDKFLRVGQFLDLIHAKAQLSLSQMDAER